MAAAALELHLHTEAECEHACSTAKLPHCIMSWIHMLQLSSCIPRATVNLAQRVFLQMVIIMTAYKIVQPTV